MPAYTERGTDPGDTQRELVIKDKKYKKKTKVEKKKKNAKRDMRRIRH